MARWFTIGCELNPPANNEQTLFFSEGRSNVGTNATITKNTSVKRSGTASRDHNSGTSNALAYTELYWGFQGANGYYGRLYFRVSALPSSTVRIAYFADTSAIPLAGARLTPGGKIQLFNETGTPAQIGSDSAATIATDTWYRLELYTKTVAGSSDACELLLDGTSVASGSGLALSDNNTGFLLYGWLNGPGASKNLYVDDVAVNDDVGGSNNTWPGAGSIVYLDPISDNARDANWTAGAGGTSNLFAAVDNDAVAGLASGSATDTSQIKNTNTTDTTGNYDANMESYTTAGVGANDTITLIQAVMQLGTSNTTTVSGAMKIHANPVGSEDSKTMGRGTAIGTYGTGWHALFGTAINSPSVTLGTSPVLRIGRRGTQATELHCAGMRIAVEYVPGVPGPKLRVVQSTLRW